MVIARTCSSPEQAVSRVIDLALIRNPRVLILGEPGAGKSTVAAVIAGALCAAGRTCQGIDADPGSPSFGIPGAVSRGEWRAGGWRLLDWEALCSLDAGRFRLPLVAAVQTLAGRVLNGILLVDAPGVVRGVAGAELMAGLVQAAGIDLILALRRQDRLPLARELLAPGVETWLVHAAPHAKPLSKRQRARQRTRLWDAYLEKACEHWVSLPDMAVVGILPPAGIDAAWHGRQVALPTSAKTWHMGEVTAKQGDKVLLRLPAATLESKLLLIRDARRAADGLLHTAKAFAAAIQYVPLPDVRPYAARPSDGPRPVVRIGNAVASLVNGIFGDPLLHVRLCHQRRSLLFDLGSGERLPARIAHQVSDVFISHAHIDHIGGFLWLLRSRIGDLPGCRVFGPPGISNHIAGLINGILWDRIGDTGPRFEIAEFQGEQLNLFAVQAGRRDIEPLGSKSIDQGVLMEEPALRVRAVLLDHRTPVLAFALEQPLKLNIRKDRLQARNLVPGPWLTELKQRIARGDHDARILLPDGGSEAAAGLARDLMLVAPGSKLVYATDLADTQGNRDRLTALAKAAHTLFCEAPFIEQDAERAAATGHLTARACGEIAMTAEVEHLVPFHFSHRYEYAPERVYEEVRAVCSRVVAPRPGRS